MFPVTWSGALDFAGLVADGGSFDVLCFLKRMMCSVLTRCISLQESSGEELGSRKWRRF